MTQLTEYSETEAGLAKLREQHHGVVHDVTTTAGMAVAKAARKELRDLRLALEAKRVELKAPALERSRLIDAEAKRITAEVLALEEPIDAQIKREEQRKEAERAAKAEAEKHRVEKIHEGIARISDCVIKLAGARSDVISKLIEEFSTASDDWMESFQEFAPIARLKLDNTLDALRLMHTAAVNAEAAAAENARVAAELEAQRIADEQRREADRILAEQKAAEAQRIIDEERQAAAAAAAAETLRVEAERKAEDEARVKAATEEKAALDAERERQDAIRAKLVAEQEALAAAELARQREELRIEREKIDAENARLKAEADERNRLEELAEIEAARVAEEERVKQEALKSEENQRLIDSATLIQAAQMALDLMIDLCLVHSLEYKALEAAIARHGYDK